MKKLLLSMTCLLIAGATFGAAGPSLEEIKNTLDQENDRMAKLFLHIPSCQMHPDDILTYNEVHFTMIKLLGSQPFSPTYGKPIDDTLLTKVTEVYDAIKAGKYLNWNPQPMIASTSRKPVQQDTSSCIPTDTHSTKSQRDIDFEKQLLGKAFAIDLISSRKQITNQDVDTLYELMPEFRATLL